MSSIRSDEMGDKSRKLSRPHCTWCVSQRHPDLINVKMVLLVNEMNVSEGPFAYNQVGAVIPPLKVFFFSKLQNVLETFPFVK